MYLKSTQIQHMPLRVKFLLTVYKRKAATYVSGFNWRCVTTCNGCFAFNSQLWSELDKKKLLDITLDSTFCILKKQFAMYI